MTSKILQIAEDAWQGKAEPTALLTSEMPDADEVSEGILMVPGFGHAFAIRHEEGLILFDTGAEFMAEKLHHDVRAWSGLPLTHAVYSHGHVDHVFGVAPFDEEADRMGRPRPVVVAHQNVEARFDRYRRTPGYNSIINQRQFRLPDLTWPTEFRRPDTTFADRFRIEAGGVVLELTHRRGETDDHVIGWLPDHKILFPGDLFLGVSPNAGNPQKAQRYPVEWAAALRWMSTLGAELMLGSHGVPVVGADRVHEALDNTARYLESLIEQTLAQINDGATLVETVHRVKVPSDLEKVHYLQPLYDEPEFIVRNLWRQFAGWYDGDPARLKPAEDRALAEEIAALCGGPEVLANRALALSEEGSHRLACHLAQLAGDAAPASGPVHSARRDVYARRAEAESSTMSRGIFAWAQAESEAVISEAMISGSAPGS